MIKKFFNDLLSSGDAVSSKRVISFIVLINLIIFAYISTFNSIDRATPEYMYDALALIVAGGLGFTVLEKVFLGKYTVRKYENDSPSEDIPPSGDNCSSDDDKPRKPRKAKYPKTDDTN